MKKIKAIILKIKLFLGMKVISLDFDGPIFNLEHLHAEHILQNYDKKYHSSEVTHWEYLYENYPTITECWTNWDNYKKAPFVDGALEFIEELKKRYGVSALQIVTSSPVSIQEEKTKMITDILGIDVIHVTKEAKSIYTKGTILIDDATHNIVDHLENTSDFGILFDLDGQFGWNKEFIPCERSARNETYDEVLQCLEKNL